MSKSNSATPEPHWSRFQQLARERFPHGKVYGVRIAGGVVLSFERVVHTHAFGAASARSLPAASERWRGFIAFCRDAGDLVIPEVHFRDGEPVLVQLEEPGLVLNPQTA